MSTDALPKSLSPALKLHRWNITHYASVKDLTSLQEAVEGLRKDLDQLLNANQSLKDTVHSLQASNKQLIVSAASAKNTVAEAEERTRHEVQQIGSGLADLQDRHQKAIEQIRVECTTASASTSARLEVLSGEISDTRRTVSDLESRPVPTRESQPRSGHCGAGDQRHTSPPGYLDTPGPSASRLRSSRLPSVSTQSGSSVIQGDLKQSQTQSRKRRRSLSAARDDVVVTQVNRRDVTNERVKSEHPQDEALPQRSIPEAVARQVAGSSLNNHNAPKSSRVEERPPAHPQRPLDPSQKPDEPPAKPKASKDSKARRKKKQDKARRERRAAAAAAATVEESSAASAPTSAQKAAPRSIDSAAAGAAPSASRPTTATDITATGPRRSCRKKAPSSYRESALARQAIVID